MWIICQIGAREHYAIPRALQQQGSLSALVTDLWVPPGHPIRSIPGARRLRDRWHPELAESTIYAPNIAMLAFELMQRLKKRSGWAVNIERNAIFQRAALAFLKKWEVRMAGQPNPTLFSYSYAAHDLFRFAKTRGWRTVLGQIDPGPEEECIVAAEHGRYVGYGSRWQPAPTAYWRAWKQEIELADTIVVNSDWSRECLLKEKIPTEKIQVVPLVYRAARMTVAPESGPNSFSKQSHSLKLLFLGQLNLRKGVARLLDAMRLLRGEPVELVMAGPSEIDPSAWGDLPNVKWLGVIPRSEVGRYYREADVFILPTLSDGYALTQLEALAHGLPVMASKCCGAAVTRGVNGWILEDLEPSTIAQAIRAACAAASFKKVQAAEFGLRELAAELHRGGSTHGCGERTNPVSDSIPTQ